jgi:heterodisulfide reductase subunit C
MFHIISSPVSLLANEVMDKETSHPANIATRQIMELDACTHCNTCSLRCSAAFAYTAFGNEFILPSEKLQFLKKLAGKNSLKDDEWEALRQGVYLCTNCDRCTVVCPVGINLRDLWINVRERLIQKEGVEPLIMSPFSFLRGLIRPSLSDVDYKKPLGDIKLALKGQFDSLMDDEKSLQLSGNGIESPLLPESDTYSSCFTCQNCTTVCPVVNSFERPDENLELLPHQIMFCLGLGQIDMASGPKMLWDCVTCYQCQEHCPQNVEVTAILFELKNLAVKKISKKKDAASI